RVDSDDRRCEVHMSDAVLTQLRDLIQEDVGRRGLRTDPARNLITACPDDFAAACHSLAQTVEPSVAVVTGFYIPTGNPPGPETDGPLGALFLARALTPLGVRVAFVTDEFCMPALKEGLRACGLEDQVSVMMLPSKARLWQTFLITGWELFLPLYRLTHLIALERVGPSYTDD